jgi:L-asparaginase II
VHAPSSAALVRSGDEPTPLHNNCSGKHAAMLIAAKALGASLDDYLALEHPIQQRNRAMLARFAEVSPEGVGVAVDGCSAPTFVLPLRAIARAYSNLIDAGAIEDAPGVRRRWMAAVSREPLAYAGEGRTCTKLVALAPGRIYPKVGAEGVYALGVSGPSLGIATKQDDGSHRATEALIATLLLRLGVDLPAEAREALERMREVPIKNHRGLVTGRLEVTLP